MKIQKADLQNLKLREKLLKYLKPHEEFSLFLIMNIKEPANWFDIYYAFDNTKILGVAAYFFPFKSFSMFSDDKKVVEEFFNVFIKKYDVKNILVNDFVGEIVLKKCLELECDFTKDPLHHFLTLDLENFKKFSLDDVKVREIEKNDEENAAKLIRQLHDTDDGSKISKDEIDKVFLSPYVFVLEKNKNIVSIAVSNGIGFNMFQILSVVTDKNYRNRKYAKAVVSKLILKLQNLGAKKSVLFVEKDNLAAFKCYQRLGFQIVGKYYFFQFK